MAEMVFQLKPPPPPLKQQLNQIKYNLRSDSDRVMNLWSNL